MAATRIVLRLNRPGGDDLRVPVKWYGEPSMADLEATCRRAIAAPPPPQADLVISGWRMGRCCWRTTMATLWC